MSDGPDICWFRRDLRVTDQPALVGDGRTPTVSVFVVDPRPLATAGRRRRILLARHLVALDARLREVGGDLLVLHGDPVSELPRLAAELRARTVRWNGDVSGYAQRRDAAVATSLATVGAGAQVHWGTLVHPPGAVVARSTGVVQRVFTPFSRAWAATARTPWPDGAALLVPAADGRGLRPDTALGVDPDDEGDLLPEGGELAAERRLGAWLDRVDDYGDRRDLPADDTGTSHLSSDLRFGTLSPRHVVDVVGTSTPGRAAFVRQLAWRDWYAHLLAERPELAHAAMKPGLDDVAWRDDPDGFEAWRTGRTGYPIVDAGMRQLAATGWMHNRVRMIAASFLVKDLLVDWRLGEAHFRHELIDAEVSQNAGNWQWVAGTGPDAAPYFRIFNPVTQSRRFDPTGAYLRRWVPELRGLDDRSIHAPWEVGPLELAAAGVHLGDEYPWPIVDHAQARDRTLAAYGAAAGR